MEIPGPGTYEFDDSRIRPSTTAHGFSRSKKSLDVTTNDASIVPGPGKYHPNQDFIKPRALEISMYMGSVRDRSRDGKEHSFYNTPLALTPGPGSYTAKSTLNDKAHKFGQRQK